MFLYIKNQFFFCNLTVKVLKFIVIIYLVLNLMLHYSTYLHLVMYTYKYVLKRVSFGSKECTKELKLECAYFGARLASFSHLGLISDPLRDAKIVLCFASNKILIGKCKHSFREVYCRIFCWKFCLKGTVNPTIYFPK